MFRVTAIASFAAMLASPAYASNGQTDASSSASATIAVYIPPIASALQASSEGAVGLWSISGQHEGIMINLIETDGYIHSVDIYSRQTSGIELQWDASMRSTQIRADWNRPGLVQNHFQVPDDIDLVSTFTVRAI